jgi:hypothetical protein
MSKFRPVKNRFLLLKCITLGALSFPTPIFICFFLLGINPVEADQRVLVTLILLLSGALIGLASYYKDSAVAAFKDWYPSDRPMPK